MCRENGMYCTYWYVLIYLLVLTGIITYVLACIWYVMACIEFQFKTLVLAPYTSIGMYFGMYWVSNKYWAMYSNTIRVDPNQEAYIVISIVVCIGMY